MPTTSNFGWTTPADTDLVKDGALAIRTLGNGIDSSMAQLKGGTTGQVLSKTNGTDMAFTWVTQDDANAIQNAIVDAKGDLIAATANDTPARLAVGNNGETLVADSSATTGLRYQETNAAGKNFVLNGAFDCWQRATASTALPTTVGYSTADRWAVNQDTTSAGTSSQATSSMPSGFRYAIQLQRNSSSTSTNPIRMYQILETQNSIPAQGKVLTFSFWAKAGANYSPTSSALNIRVSTGTGTDQSVTNLPSGSLTGYAEVVSTSVTLTTSWQRFTLTSSTVSSSATQIGFGFFWNPTGTAGANDWVQITGVQLEIGSVATGFQRAGGTLAGELAACQRYYFVKVAAGTQPATFGMASYIASNDLRGTFGFPVEMRVTPTLVATSGTNYYKTEMDNDQFNSITLNWTTKTEAGWYNSGDTASGTKGQASMVGSNNALASIALSAEL